MLCWLHVCAPRCVLVALALPCVSTVDSGWNTREHPLPRRRVCYGVSTSALYAKTRSREPELGLKIALATIFLYIATWIPRHRVHAGALRKAVDRDVTYTQTPETDHALGGAEPQGIAAAAGKRPR